MQVDQHSSTLLFSDKKKGNIPDFFDNILSLVIVAKKKRKNLKVTEPTEISTKS